MKVLQVLPALEGGGVEKGTLDLAQALVQAGHESVVASAGGRMATQLREQGSHHATWDLGRKSPLTFLKVRAFRQWLAQEQFDVLHLRSRMPGWIAWLAWRRMNPATRPRLVSTVHGMHSVSRYSEIVTCGERVIVVSEAIRRYVRENYPRCNPDKLRLIYRGISPEEFPRHHQPSEQWTRDWFKRYPQLQGKAVLTLAGRLTRLKGHHDFLDLLAQLHKQGLQIHGLIVGGEDPKRLAYAQELYQAVADRGLRDVVTFAGHRNDLRDIYAVSKVVLSLSTQPESFGRTVLEPLSEGVAVVGYDHGGVAEILAALYPGGAVPVRDVSAAAARVTAILEGKIEGPRRNERFLLEHMTGDTLSLYAELLSSPRSPS